MNVQTANTLRELQLKQPAEFKCLKSTRNIDSTKSTII